MIGNHQFYRLLNCAFVTLLIALAALIGCSGDRPDHNPGTSDGDTDIDSDADTDSDQDSDTDHASDTDTDSEISTDEDPSLVEDCDLEDIVDDSVPESSVEGPPGYVFCADEDETTFLFRLSDVAFGGDGSFKYLENQVGEITFSNSEFGDPAPGKKKAGFCKPVTELSTAALESVLAKLTKHINQTETLAPAEINAQGEILAEQVHVVGANEQILGEAFELVQLYESNIGPLFVNEKTKNGFSRTPAGGLELERAMLALQQGIIDYGFTPINVHKMKSLSGALFKTSSYFPGSAEPPSDPTSYHAAVIDGSQPKAWGWPVMYETMPARRPTGFYVAPGSVATVVVPESLVNKGYFVRVGAHSWDLSNKPVIKRLDRVSILYPIMCRKVHVANPLGGGIYIEVPYEADAGIVNVHIAGAVRSPLFSATSFLKTSAKEWNNAERKHPGPFADFVSDKFMMQVPTSWIYNMDDPSSAMADWDAAMDAVSELFGFPLVRSKTVLYAQVDVIIRGGAYFPGYPQSNTPYNPNKEEQGNSDHWLLKGARYADSTTFHELGHSQLFTKFQGETEAAVNFLYVAAQNKKFGVDLDTAFGNSFGGQSQISIEQAAIQWMVRPNFRDGKPMDITNSEMNEVRYQHKGYGKYAEIVNLFGWEPLDNFWASVQEDYLAGITYSRNSDPTDSRIIRMSRKAGADLTPLVHFWGVHPDDPEALKKDIENEGIKPSAAIYDRLVYYKSIIPMDNQEFRDHANITYPKGIHDGKSPNYGEGWYYVWLPKYNESHGIAAQKALQDIIDRYFPNGRP